jgi:DNA-binding LacI/PurR family transcriptional regulator
MAERPPGMVDVARLAGVSHITVSRVLNGHPSVSEKTRQRVLDAIQTLGYRRNTVARALKSGRSSTIGVVIAGSELFELPRILTGVEAVAREAGYWVNLASWQGGGEEELAETLQRLTDQSVEAIAVIADRPGVLAALNSVTSRVPVTVVMSGDVPNPGLAFVELDQESGARQAVRHLLGLGHRTVAHFSGALRVYDARARVAGWRDELTAAGAPPGELLEGDFTAESGYRLARRVAEPGELPTALFVGNDQMAMGVLAAFAELGIRVPEDVSLVGFDDVAGSAFLVPSLTTVRQDFVALGATSVRLILDQLAGSAPEHVKIEPRLIVRRSTAAPRR